MHKRKQLLAIGLGIVMAVSVAACGSNVKKTGQQESGKYGKIWSLASTTKVEQYNVNYEPKQEMKLTYRVVRNEYESMQLLITAEKDITSFQLQKADLRCGQEVLSADNIEVYVQKYVPYNDVNGNGSMPDALIPMDTANEYEENKIAAGSNGAMWITVYAPKETVAGTYTGEFKLSIEGEKGTEELSVPVSVEVEDYTLSDEVTAATLFSWRYRRVAPGELDGSIEMMRYYYEFFKDYHISLQSMPLNGLSGEEFIANVKKYYDEITTYCILSTAGDISGTLEEKRDLVTEQILALAAESSKEKNYFEKAMMYFLDEPNMSNDATRNACITRIQKMKDILQSCVDIINADTTGVYDEFKKIKNWEESITNIPRIIPILLESVEWMFEKEGTPEGDALIDSLNCICPVFSVFSDRIVYELKEFCERNDIVLWWYGCVSPASPYPTYHIGDENLLSARSVSWLQKKYDIKGNLYWDAAAYTDENGDYLNEFIDLYEKPVRISKSSLPAGDGFLTYPGAAYGIYGPIPTVRIMSIRDGMEEYELLSNLEKTLEKQRATFGEKFDVSVAMDVFYNQLAYEGIKMYRDGENGFVFQELRDMLIESVVAINKGIGLAMGEIKLNGTEASFEYYVQKDAKVQIDGQEQTPISGTQYSYSLNLEEKTYVDVTVIGKDGEQATYKQFIGFPIYTLNAISDKNTETLVSLTEKSSVKFTESKEYSTDGTSLQFKIKGVVTGNTLVDATFVPSAKISTELFEEIKLSQTKNISFDVYNPGEEFVMKIRLYSGNSHVDYGDFVILPGANTLTLDISNQSYSQMDNVDTLAFEFANTTDGKATDYEFYLDNFVYDK